MNKTVLILFAGLLLLTGCARTYVITLNNGERISTHGKPRQQSGMFVYRDMSGRDVAINALRVREIAPSSMVTDETAGFKPVSSK
jgi:hypothetical protein